eukprot:1111579-Prymnesium_polylepis.1
MMNKSESVPNVAWSLANSVIITFQSVAMSKTTSAICSRPHTNCTRRLRESLRMRCSARCHMRRRSPSALLYISGAAPPPKGSAPSVDPARGKDVPSVVDAMPRTSTSGIETSPMSTGGGVAMLDSQLPRSGQETA